MIAFPPRRILVPFDFSPGAKAALRRAQDWARRFSARIDVLYVEPLPIEATWDFQIPTSMPARRRDVVAKIRSLAGPGVKIKYRLGDPVVVILSEARARRSDLIILGTHGRKGFARLMMGSVAETVVRLAKVPVLVDHAGARKAKRVLAPTNFTEYAEAGVLFAAGVAARLKLPLSILFVAPDPVRKVTTEILLRDLVDRLPPRLRSACRPTAGVRVGHELETLIRAGEEAGLVVLVAHRKSLLKDVVLGTTAERVLRFCAAPILTLPASARPRGTRRGTVEPRLAALLR